MTKDQLHLAQMLLSTWEKAERFGDRLDPNRTHASAFVQHLDAIALHASTAFTALTEREISRVTMLELNPEHPADWTTQISPVYDVTNISRLRPPPTDPEPSSVDEVQDGDEMATRLWEIVEDAFDDAKFKQHIDSLAAGDQAEMFGIAIVELNRLSKRMVIVQRATDLLVGAIEGNGTDAELDAMIEDTDALDRTSNTETDE